MSPAWTTDKSLLSPRFESYRLAPGELSSSTKRLPSNAPLGRVLEPTSAASSKSNIDEATLRWREAKFRAGFNHLFSVEEGLAWIDATGGIWSSSADLGLQQRGQLPEPRETDLHGQYPSIQAVPSQPRQWLVSDGWGTLHLFDSASSSISASASLSTPWSCQAPFNLHLAYQLSDSVISVLLSLPSPKDLGNSQKDRVCLVCAHFNIQDAALQVHYSLKGDQYPAHVALQDDHTATILAGTPFTTLATEVQDVLQPSSSKSTVSESQKPVEPSFSWTQDDESLVLSFPWPSELKDNPPQDLKVVLTPQFLNVHSLSHREMAVSHRKLWGVIDTQTSTWALDPDRLYISLEKKHQGTTWPTVFDDNITDTSQNPPEDYTPEQLNAMKDVLAHMTSEEQLDDDADPNPATTLLGDGADRDDLASNQEDRVVKQTLTLATGELSEATKPFELLSSPLVQSGQPASGSDSVVVKRQVDGLLIDRSWKHIGTYPALDYVLASKRSLNLRFVLHHQEHFCIAIDASGSLFAYYGPPEPKATMATQTVFQQSQSVTEIVGAGLVPAQGLVILAKGALVLIQGLPGV